MTAGVSVSRRSLPIRRRLGPFGSVAGGSAIGQLALGASLPLVARLYSPAEVGVFAVLLAGSQVASIVVTGRLEQILPRLSEGNRWSTARTVMTIGTGLAPLAAAALLAIAGRSGLLDLLAVAGLVASLCLVNVATFVLLSAQDYRAVAFLRMGNGVVTAAAQVIGGLIRPDVIVLLIAYAVGNLVAALLAAPALRRLRSARDDTRLAQVARDEHFGRFAGSVGTGAVLSNLGLALPLIGVSLLFGEAAAGGFYLARRLLMVPTQLVAASVSEVSYAIVARESIDRTARLVYAWLRKFRLIAVAVLAVGLISAPLVSLVIGGGYDDVAWTVALLTLPAVAQMIATSFSNVLLALRMELLRTVWNVGRLVGLLAVYWWAHLSSASYLEVVTTFAVYTVLTYAGLLAMTLRAITYRRTHS